MAIYEFNPMTPEQAGECEAILRSLPEWFGIEEAIVQYRRALESGETYTLTADDALVGFITISQRDRTSAEIEVMAIRPELHRRGMGRKLLRSVGHVLRHHGIATLRVRTLGPSHPDAHYAATRAFYEACGFVAIEESTEPWGPENPSLLMEMTLRAPAPPQNGHRR